MKSSAMKWLVGLIPLAALVAVISPSMGQREASRLDTSFDEFVTPGGDIRMPRRDYRSEWSHLGTFVVPAEKDQGMGFHDVYTQPESVRAYKATGRFPDGAVLVKEVNAMETARMTTGDASWAGKPAQWFVMIKDEKGRYPDHPLWGKGWGWALFKDGDPPVNISTSYRVDCLGCHIPARATDWIFVEGYPSIRAANKAFQNKEPSP